MLRNGKLIVTILYKFITSFYPAGYFSLSITVVVIYILIDLFEMNYLYGV